MPEELKENAILVAPTPTKEARQRSVNISDLYLTRFTPPWSRPSSLPAYTWRAWVMNQPVALVCRETLIASLEGLDWMIVPRDMNHKDELDPVCRYYTKLLERGGNYPELGLDYTGLLEWIVGDLLDTPFGGFAEIGRKNDTENGRIQWIKPVDAGTLYPTLNDAYPVVQYYQGYEVVSFPAYAQSRIVWSPHQYLFREGWGVAPPEKIYFALDMLNKGDKYYANLLIDVPAAGILDLGDMDADSAKEWIDSFRSFVNDTSTSFKIPVLYEHNNKIDFLPFGKPPSDIMFDRITMKYAALVCGAYGMSLSDIGLEAGSNGGETLAGSIRGERKTRKTGFARLKKKWTYFINSFLPDTIQILLQDQDDELSVAIGRARLGSATAFNLHRRMGTFSPQEIRSQTIKDGLMDASIPDKLPKDAEPEPAPASFAPKQPGVMGKPVPPSSGGHGEIKQSVISHKVKKQTMNKVVNDLLDRIYPKVEEALHNISEDEIYLVRSVINESLFDETDALGIQPILEQVMKNKILMEFKDKGIKEELMSVMGENINLPNIDDYVQQLLDSINAHLNSFMGKAISVLLSEIMTEEVIDKGDSLDYNSIVEKVRSQLSSSLNELVNVHISNEVQNILDKMESSND